MNFTNTVFSLCIFRMCSSCTINAFDFQPEGTFVEWKALDELDGPPADNEWTVVDTVGYKADRGTEESGNYLLVSDLCFSFHAENGLFRDIIPRECMLHWYELLR